MTNSDSLTTLRTSFRQSSSRSMPIAGMIFWGIVGIAALRIDAIALTYIVLVGSGMIFPMGVLIDKLRGKTMQRADGSNPVMSLFLQSLVMAVLLWPLVIIAARAAADPNLIVLGAAILMGIIWAPFGWAADDPVGLQHALGRIVGCYAAYLLAPEPWRATAISAVALLAYGWSITRMRRD